MVGKQLKKYAMKSKMKENKQKKYGGLTKCNMNKSVVVFSSVIKMS